MDFELEQVLESEIAKDERLLWSGQPAPGRMLLKTLPIFFFAIPWTAFTLFWEWAALTQMGDSKNGAPEPMRWVFALFGVPFVLIGFAMLLAPWSAYRNALRTIYAVTSKRLLIITASSTRSVDVYGPKDIMYASRRERSDGSGDVIFAHVDSVSSKGTRRRNQIGFFGIDSVHEVERLVLELKESEKS